MSTLRTLGIDVSAWQDNNLTPKRIDWSKAAAMGTKFAFVRASVDAKEDEDFDYNWRESKKYGILRGAYHFFNYQHSARNQAKLLADIIKDDPGELPPVMDLEYHSPYGLIKHDNIIPAIQIFRDVLVEEGHKRMMLYSNPDTILHVLTPLPDWLVQIPLWVAHYGVENPMEKAVAPWGKWTFWQYTAKGDGPKFGMESLNLDMDWFNGSQDELRQFAGIGTVPIPEPEKPWTSLPEAERLEKLCAAHPELWK